MIALGWLGTIIGAVMFFFSANMRETSEYRWGKAATYWGSSNSDIEAIDIAYYAGIVIFIIGVLFLIIGYIRHFSNKKYKSYNGQNINHMSSPVGQNSHQSSVMPNKIEEHFCIECGKPVQAGAAFCPYCGSQLKTEKKCPVCGNVSSEDCRFCSKCGYDMNTSTGDLVK